MYREIYILKLLYIYFEKRIISTDIYTVLVWVTMNIPVYPVGGHLQEDGQ